MSIIIVYEVVLCGINATSSVRICSLCHEMNIVVDAGWKNSVHYNNKTGIVPECKDCHINPGINGLIEAKLYHSVKDIVVHLFGTNDPAKIQWSDLSRKARSRIKDEACLRCHSQLMPAQLTLKGQLYHSEGIMTGKKCLDCHVSLFHGGHRFIRRNPEHESDYYNEKIVLSSKLKDSRIRYYGQDGENIKSEGSKKSGAVYGEYSITTSVDVILSYVVDQDGGSIDVYRDNDRIASLDLFSNIPNINHYRIDINKQKTIIHVRPSGYNRHKKQVSLCNRVQISYLREKTDYINYNLGGSDLVDDLGISP